jgi:hypothetical protein
VFRPVTTVGKGAPIPASKRGPQSRAPARGTDCWRNQGGVTSRQDTGVSGYQNISPKTSNQILRHIHRGLNVDETKKLITQFTMKSRDESFEPN